MIIVSGRIYVRPNKRKLFLSLSADAIAQARRSDGCRDFVVAADPIEANRVNVYEEWSSKKALAAFRGAGPNEQLSSLIERIDVGEYVVSRKRG